jgi:hypothetical protein
MVLRELLSSSFSTLKMEAASKREVLVTTRHDVTSLKDTTEISTALKTSAVIKFSVLVYRRLHWISHRVFCGQVKVKVVRPRTGHEGQQGEQSCSSTLSFTSSLDGGGWLKPHPGRFTPGKRARYPLYRRLSGFQGQSARGRKISPSPEFEPWTIQFVASRYAKYAIPAHVLWAKEDFRLYCFIHPSSNCSLQEFPAQAYVLLIQYFQLRRVCVPSLICLNIILLFILI